MWRFFLIATALVVGGLLILLRFEHRGRALEVASVRASGTPTLGRAQGRSTFAPSEVEGEAPWAMSALPECFEQVFAAHGKAVFVRGQLPGGARPVVGRAQLRRADCIVDIEPGTATVTRGAERLVIPPRTQFYRWPDRIGFIRVDARGAELRVYRLRDGGQIVLTARGGRNGP